MLTAAMLCYPKTLERFQANAAVLDEMETVTAIFTCGSDGGVYDYGGQVYDYMNTDVFSGSWSN